MNDEDYKKWFIDIGLMDNPVVITEGRYSSGMSLCGAYLAYLMHCKRRNDMDDTEIESIKETLKEQSRKQSVFEKHIRGLMDICKGGAILKPIKQGNIFKRFSICPICGCVLMKNQIAVSSWMAIDTVDWWRCRESCGYEYARSIFD